MAVALTSSVVLPKLARWIRISSRAISKQTSTVTMPTAPAETMSEALSGVWDRIHRRIEDHLRPAELATTRLVEGPLDQAAVNGGAGVVTRSGDLAR